MRRTRLRVGVLVVVAFISSSPLVADEFMFWSADFSPISLDAITTRDEVSTGSEVLNLHTTGNCEISADNSSAAVLTGPGGDVLLTDYALSFDGDGVTSTGGSDVDYTSYDSFLVPAVQITCVGGDSMVKVTLSARARNQPGDVANAGSYSAVVTLTTSWTGP